MFALVALLASLAATPLEPRFTWRADFSEGSLARSEARVQAAVPGPHDEVVIAGSAVGRLQIGRGAEFSNDRTEQAFLAKIDRTGRVVWFRELGSVPNHGMLMGLGITALARTGREMVAIGDFRGREGMAAGRAEPPKTQIAWIDERGQVRKATPLELPGVLSIVSGPDRDLYVGGCERHWTPAPAPGLSPILVQTGAFVARLSPDGRVRWRKRLREAGDGIPTSEPTVGPVMDCVTELLPRGAIGVAAGGMFNGALRIGKTDLGSKEGTFLAGFSSTGDVEWARTVATRLVTTSFDVRPQFGGLPSGSVVGAGVMPSERYPAGGSGIVAISADGTENWTRSIETGTGCCNVDSPLTAVSGRQLLSAGITAYGRSVILGNRKLIENVSSNAFVLWIGQDGSALRGRALPESATELARLVPGRAGVWVVGTHRENGPGTGIFAHWLAH